MRIFGVLFVVLLGFAFLNTVLLVLPLVGISVSSQTAQSSSQAAPQLPIAILFALQRNSEVLAPISWIAVIGTWRWRGRNRARWTEFGLSEDLFRSLIRMKGGKTRALLMEVLAAPKDRFRLAQELNLDWKTIDYEIKVLLRHGLISEHIAYGNVRLYKTTPIGSLVLKLVKELSEPLNPEFKAGSDVSDTKPESSQTQFD